jgi:hypothetical protein
MLAFNARAKHFIQTIDRRSDEAPNFSGAHSPGSNRSAIARYLDLPRYRSGSRPISV